jgi:hypothetical protein
MDTTNGSPATRDGVDHSDRRHLGWPSPRNLTNGRSRKHDLGDPSVSLNRAVTAWLRRAKMAPGGVEPPHADSKSREIRLSQAVEALCAPVCAPVGTQALHASTQLSGPHEADLSGLERSPPERSNRRPPGCDPESRGSRAISDFHGFAMLAGTSRLPALGRNRVSTRLHARRSRIWVAIAVVETSNSLWKKPASTHSLRGKDEQRSRAPFICGIAGHVLAGELQSSSTHPIDARARLCPS